MAWRTNTKGLRALLLLAASLMVLGQAAQGAIQKILPVAPREHPWRTSLASVDGRLLEADGSPAAGLRIALVGLDRSMTRPWGASPWPPGSFEGGEVATDKGGLFAFTDVAPADLHVLILDPGGPRASLCILDQSLAPGESTHLGNLTLLGFGTLDGRVVDEGGAPVPGARVRFWPVPAILEDTGILRLGPASRFLVNLDLSHPTDPEPPDDAAAVFKLPGWLTAIVDRLPLSETQADEEGEFRLVGVPVGRVNGGADFAGRFSAELRGVEVKAGEVLALGDLAILTGQTVSGVVVDDEGNPVRGARVVAGPVDPTAPIFVPWNQVTSGAGGRFVVGVPSKQTPLVAAASNRREGPVIGSRWSTRLVRDSGDVELVVPDWRPLRVAVRSHDGSAVEGAKVLALTRDGDPSSIRSDVELALSSRHGPPAAAQAVEPGLVEVEAMPVGHAVIRVDAPNHAPTLIHHVHPSRESEPLAVTLSRGRPIRLALVDGITGEPLANAHVRLGCEEGKLQQSLGTGWTGVEGRFGLEHFPGIEFFAQRSRTWSCRVEHPRYGHHVFDSGKRDAPGPFLVIDSPGEIRIEATLGPVGALEGRISWAGSPPTHGYSLSVKPQHPCGLNFPIPRMAATRADHTFRLGGLSPGIYEVRWDERPRALDPVSFIDAWLSTMTAPFALVTVPAGGTGRLELDLLENGEPPPPRVEGSILKDGVPWAGARIELSGKSIATTDAQGHFHFDGLERSGPYALTIGPAGFVPEPRPRSPREVGAALRRSRRKGRSDDEALSAFQEDREADARELAAIWRQVHVGHGGTTAFHLSIETAPVRLRCLDKDTGQPLEGVEVSGGASYPKNRKPLTDDQGYVELTLARDRLNGEPYPRFSASELKLSRPGYGIERLPYPRELFHRPSGTAAEQQEPPLQVVYLNPTVPCAGTVTKAGDPLADMRIYDLGLLSLDSPNDAYSHSLGPELSIHVNPDGTFGPGKLVPGRYRAVVFDPFLGRELMADFLLPADGSTSLKIHLE